MTYRDYKSDDRCVICDSRHHDAEHCDQPLTELRAHVTHYAQLREAVAGLHECLQEQPQSTETRRVTPGRLGAVLSAICGHRDLRLVVSALDLANALSMVHRRLGPVDATPLLPTEKCRIYATLRQAGIRV